MATDFKSLILGQNKQAFGVIPFAGRCPPHWMASSQHLMRQNSSSTMPITILFGMSAQHDTRFSEVLRIINSVYQIGQVTAKQQDHIEPVARKRKQADLRPHVKPVRLTLLYEVERGLD